MSEPPEKTSSNRDNDLPLLHHLTRREFIGGMAIAGTGMLMANDLFGAPVNSLNAESSVAISKIDVYFFLNEVERKLAVDPRTTLLDALRNELTLTGTKKGCDHGQCGACTVLVNDRRINSCLMLAAMCQGAKVTTIEGLAAGGELHPIQSAFIKHDAFQCGYCTPGQICSAVGLLKEGHAHTDGQIRELMSGNICRCGAYQNILAAIKDAQAST